MANQRQSRLDDVYYEAMKARDSRFDGKFFVGVKTTGIYCRPICPAKPKRENVEFFRSALESERAGYRPCLRCRPESAPESPVWIGKSAVVRRALGALGRMDQPEPHGGRELKLHHRRELKLDEDRFAALFGVTARHLRRLFVEEVGKTPKQLSSENRLNLSRKLIVETHLSISEIAFASGFGSVRRFNEAFKARFKRSPGEIRRSPISDLPSGSGGGLRVSLSYRPPFDFEGVLRHFQAHRLEGLEWVESGKMHRVISLGGKTGRLAIENDPKRARLLVEIEFPDPSAIHVILGRVRGMCDVDSDPVVVANSLESESKTKRLLRRYPGIRLASGWDPFEVSIAVILGQLVSVDRGRGLVAALIRLLGQDSAAGPGDRIFKLFPSPEAIAASDLAGLPTTGARKRTLREFSHRISIGALSLEPTQDVERFIEAVRSIPGIGPWTASTLALRVLRHTDAFPESDLILARALQIHSKEAVARMSPWRGYAAALYWREYAYKKKPMPAPKSELNEPKSGKGRKQR